MSYTTGMPRGVQFNAKQRDYQLFPEEYFAATDCQIYFNDVYVEDLTGISFKLTEKAMPIFSYADNTWVHFARGNRVVQGYFRLAFREAGYVNMMMDHFGQMNGQTKTHLGYLMNEGTRNIYNGYNGAPSRTFGQILETLEDLFQRNHADKTAKKPDSIGTRKETIYFDWDVKTKPMQLNESDSTERHKNRTERYGTTGAVTQLQTWLKNHGYTFKKETYKWQKYYGNDTWYTDKGLGKNSAWNGNDAHDKKAAKINGGKPNLSNALFTTPWINNKIGKKSGDWYMMTRYNPMDYIDNQGNNVAFKGYPIHKATVKASAGHSWNERELQQAFKRYPGKTSLQFTGSSDGLLEFDGRYGSGPTKAIRHFMQLAGYDDGSKGYWLSETTKKHLEMGFEVNGQYDFPTKLAVLLFQNDMIEQGKLKGRKEGDGNVDEATMKLMTEEIDVEYTIIGESLYSPEEAYESRMAMYEREIWGRPFYDKAEQVRSLESFFYRSRRWEKKDENYTDVLFQKGFDIYINYGPISQYVLAKNYEIADDVSFNTTVKAIRNVQIYDVEQILDPNTGYVIEEIYYFYSKDLD